MEKGGVYFTEVSADVFTGNVGIMCATPVYRDGELVAVVGADLLLNDMAQSVENSADGSGFVCIVNDQGHVVFSPMTEGSFRAQESSQATDLRQARGAIAVLERRRREVVEMWGEDIGDFFVLAKPETPLRWCNPGALQEDWRSFRAVAGICGTTDRDF